MAPGETTMAPELAPPDWSARVPVFTRSVPLFWASWPSATSTELCAALTVGAPMGALAVRSMVATSAAVSAVQ